MFSCVSISLMLNICFSSDNQYADLEDWLTHQVIMIMINTKKDKKKKYKGSAGC